MRSYLPAPYYKPTCERVSSHHWMRKVTYSFRCCQPCTHSVAAGTHDLSHGFCTRRPTLNMQMQTCTACDTNGRVHGTNHINIRNIQHVLNLLEWKHEHCTKYVWHICQYNLLIPRRLEKLFRQEFPRNVVVSRPKKVTTPSGSWRDSRLVIYWEAASWGDHWDGWATIKQCWENNSALKSWQFSSTKNDIKR